MSIFFCFQRNRFGFYACANKILMSFDAELFGFFGPKISEKNGNSIFLINLTRAFDLCMNFHIQLFSYFCFGNFLTDFRPRNPKKQRQMTLKGGVLKFQMNFCELSNLKLNFFRIKAYIKFLTSENFYGPIRVYKIIKVPIKQCHF